jgi:hypothetical protein
MSTLRSSLIRLAATNPEVRPYILPILQVKVASPDFLDWLRRTGLAQALKAATSAPPSGLTPEQKAVITKASHLLKVISSLPVVTAPPAVQEPGTKYPPGSFLSLLPSKVVDNMIYVRYPYFFDGEQSAYSRESTLNDLRRKWSQMPPEELKDLLTWISRNSPTMRRELTRYGVL